MYTIEFDPQRRLLKITNGGFWTLETINDFAEEVMARAADLRRRYGEFAVLSDSRDMPVQAAPVAAAFQSLLAESMKITQGPFATVVGGALVKMQTDRVLKAHHTRTFLSIEDAEAWIAERWEAQRAA